MADRCSRLWKDVRAVVSFCETCSFIETLWEVQDENADCLQLTFRNPQKDGSQVEYIFNFSTDYPEGTVVCCSQDQGSLETKSEPIMAIFRVICEEWCRNNGVVMPSPLAERPSQEQQGQERQPGLQPPVEQQRQQEGKEPERVKEGAQHQQESQEMEFSPPPEQRDTIATQVSVASSEYTETSEGDFDDDYDDYDVGYDEVGMEEEGLHPLLEDEIGRVQDLYGSNAIDSRIHAGIDEMDAFLYIDMNNYLDEHAASAWGVKLSEPLVILLHIRSVSRYLDGLEPQVDVFQALPSAKGERKKVGLGSQMRKIMQTFVSQQWRTLSNAIVGELLQKTSKPQREPQPQDQSLGTTPTNKDAMLAHMLEMGFGAEESLEALSSTNNDLGNACAMLAQQSVDCGSKKPAPSLSPDIKQSPPTPPYSPARSKREVPSKGVVRQTSMGAMVDFVKDGEEDMQNDKDVPLLDNGFLAQCMEYALKRFRSLNEFCVICDERHVLETGMIKPCVCTRELCVFAFQSLGVMADAAEAIATDADVVDLLIAMANAAANSGRANIILDPFPSLVDPGNPNKLALDPKEKNFNLVKQVLKEVVASRGNMLKGRSSNLKQDLDTHHKLAFPLMQWIVATCRAFIVLLPEDRQLRSMNTKYQFLLISSPPAKEVLFQQAKVKHGSTFAFHGSSIENWHSIMRKGLINASGTRYQLHGAAYGKGIYLSPVSSVSFGYSGYYGHGKREAPGTKESLAGKLDLRCIALCEVVTSKELKKNGDIWVSPNSDYVCTRFFFVYDEGSVAVANMDTRQPAFRKEIDHAVAHIHAFRKRK